MIKYNLKCHNNHEFESWFSNSNEFEKLNKKKLLECIFCNSKKISKSIMSPMISVTNDNKDKLEKDNNILKIEKNSLLQIRQYIEKNFEYVGADFGKKVREIYYDRDSKKRIYGTTTPEREMNCQRKELT